MANRPLGTGKISNTPQKHAVKSYHDREGVAGPTGTLPASKPMTGSNVDFPDRIKLVETNPRDNIVLPNMPTKDASIDHWFGYYYQCRIKGVDFTLKDLASETGFQLSYLQLLLRQYRREHNLD